jgi:tripeptide aminopeptidase
MTTARTSLAQLRITRLATMLPVHRAFHWLHLHQPQLRLWQLEMLAIPAPTFGEAARAQWFVERFTALGLANVRLDAEGNALAELPSASPEPNQPCLLLSAHLDTVFPAGTDTVAHEDGPKIFGPGACDNGAGLTALLALVAALKYAEIAPPIPILFAANVGEEGEGDLRGMRHLFNRGPYAGRISAALALEGSGTSTAVTRALGSRRFRVTISGPGGHSWTDATTPNPITLLSRGIAALADSSSLTSADDETRTTFSPGQISGGTSINSIPQSAMVTLDLRSTDPAQLDLNAAVIRQTFADLVAQANRQSPETPIVLDVETIGDRPAASLPADSPLLDTPGGRPPSRPPH